MAQAAPAETIPFARSDGDVEGQPWSFGPFTSSFKLLSIRVWGSFSWVHGLQFQYELASGKRWSPIYGDLIGGMAEIPLENDFLTEIHKSYTSETHEFLSYIEFIANRSGGWAYGNETKYKSDIIVQGSIAGFYGVTGRHIDAFGIYEKPNIS